MVLYFLQKDRYLLLYSNYLFSVAIYLLFRRVTNYDSFEVSQNKLAFTFDYPLILYMLASYVYFISIILEINNNAKIIKFAVYSFYTTATLFLIEHMYKVWFTDQTYLTREYFVFSKVVMVTFAFIGLLGAWTIRKTIFVRIILGGGILYALFSLFTIVSVYFQVRILGLYQYDLYFVGCILDILMFSSALGYRSQLINKDKMATKELLIETSKNNERLLLENKTMLEAENKERAIQSELTKKLQDEVGASLSSIHVYADLAAKVIDSDPVKSAAYMAKIAAQSQQLMDETGDTLWATHLSQARIHNAVIDKIKAVHYEIVGQTGLNFEITTPDNFYSVDLTKKQALFMIIQLKATIKEAIFSNEKHLVINVYELWHRIQ